MKKLLLLFYINLFASIAWGQQKSLAVEIEKQLPLAYANSENGIKQMQTWLQNATSMRDTLAIIAAHQSLCKLHLYQCKNENAWQQIQSMQPYCIGNNLFEAKLLLLQAHYYYFYKNESQAFANHNRLSLLMKNINAVEVQIDYAMYLGNMYYNNSDSALYFYEKASQLAASKNISYEKSLAQISLAYLLRNKKADYINAHLFIDSVINVSTKNDYSNVLAAAYNVKGSIYHKQSEYDLTLKNLTKALQLCKTTENIVGLINCYVNLGNVQEKIGNGTTNEYYLQGIELSIKHKYPVQLPRLYQNFAASIELVYPDSGMPYYKKAVAAAQQINDKHIQAYALFNMGEIFAKKKQYDLAQKNMYEALHLFEELNETSNMGWLLPCIVKLEQEINEPKKTPPAQLKAMLDKALALNANGNNYETLEDIYQSYITIYKSENNFAMANAYQEKLISLKDTIFNLQKLKDAIELSEKLNVAEQKNTIAALNLKNNKTLYQRNITILIFSFLCIAGIALYFINRKRVARKNQLNLLAQKDAFRNQLSSDLHDEIGTMLTGLALQADVLSVQSTPRQKNALQEISSISRHAMEQMRDIVWALDSSKDTYDNLFDKMIAHAEFQLGLKNIVPTFDIEHFAGKQEISPATRQHIYLIFKEAIANILKHSNASQVIITMKQNTNDKTLSIKDNGQTSTPPNKNGTGINSMHNRAKKINGQLNIATTQGYAITLHFN
ncbi:MAG: hypothetical protein IPO27_08365 [Bacteroidetes bacterium]|nr:hypothetical protein [Bacteroidota bacterium]